MRATGLNPFVVLFIVFPHQYCEIPQFFRTAPNPCSLLQRIGKIFASVYRYIYLLRVENQNNTASGHWDMNTLRNLYRFHHPLLYL